MESIVYVIFGVILGVCKCEYVAINPKPAKLTPCDNISSVTLLERFFDLVFTEFHNTPPACVCVQTCPRQPTYCYPNGCLKNQERRKIEETTYLVEPKVNFEAATKSHMFGVDHRDIVDDLLERPGLITSHGEVTEKLMPADLIFHPYPFKDLVMKYRKVPKLEMKYNLREQVKNTKTQKLNMEKNIDISKTRWPSSKHLLHGKSPFGRVRYYTKNDDTRQAKFFVSMTPDYEIYKYSPVFYKKYIAKRENNNAVNVESMYLYQTDSANFTLESIIDGLIENGLNKSKHDTKFKNDIEFKDTDNKETTTDTNINDLLDDKTELNSNNNRAINIISMNSLNENKDVNKYSHDINITKPNSVLEMIASMSNEIEKQNKVSLKFMEHITGIKNTITFNESSFVIDKSLENGTISNLEKVIHLNITENVLAIENHTNTFGIESVIEQNISLKDFTTHKPESVTKKGVYKKSKQSVSRKLTRRKINKALM